MPPRDRLRGQVAGGSAEAAYRSGRRRRRRVRRVTAAAALFAFVVGMALLNSALFRPDGSGRPLDRARLVAAAVAVAVSVVGVALLRTDSYGGRDVERWARGAEGERLTEQILRTLPGRRWAVWHDLAVPGSRANIDHLVVGRTGVWVVDTKTTRSPVRCGWRTVHLGDRRLDTGSTRWEASMVAEMLDSELQRARRAPLTRREGVRAVVAVHAPAMRARGGRVSGVAVVPSGELEDRLRRGRRRVRGRRWAELVAGSEALWGPAAHGGRARRNRGDAGSGPDSGAARVG